MHTDSVCRGQSKFDECSEKFSRRVENAVQKGEIGCYKQFLLFPQPFQKTVSADTCGLFEKEFNGPEKETLKNMSKSRLFDHDCI